MSANKTSQDVLNAALNSDQDALNVDTHAIPTTEEVNTASFAGSVALENSKVAKASAGVLFELHGYNTKGSAQYIQLHDAASLPADTAVPKVTVYAPANSQFELKVSSFGIYFSNGIVVCNSSTAGTKTIAAADCLFYIYFK